MSRTKHIAVAPDSELAGLLEEAKKTPLLLEMDGLAYRLAVDEEKRLWEGYYDADETRRVLDEMIGTLPRDEADRMLADLERRRDEAVRLSS
jgi:hypothetical protein